MVFDTAERAAHAPEGRRRRGGQADQEAEQKIGDLVLDNDILREALKPYPLDRKSLTMVRGENR